VSEKSNKLLTFNQARSRLRVSRETLRRRIASGELEAFKIGDHITSPYRIPETAIDAYLRNHRVIPARGAGL
jgi:excisionase family DNA binding protein